MNVNLTTLNDVNLMDLYAQVNNFPEQKKIVQKSGKIIKTMRNQNLMDKLTVRRNKHMVQLGDQNVIYEEKKKKSNERKTKIETLPHDLTTAITTGQKMITKFSKRSRMKGNNLFTSATTPTSNAKNSLKTTINNSVNQGVFKVNKSFLNKLNKMKH